ncbi:MAG: selenocysteine-specific translation elongation factor, partial [Armatimonadota bacterium]|nr:selenocysteine-specific translation elongation factor [Armatimonadota bacterium]
MKNIIIGTAGHVDHGKTTLIKALTGIETDRLREEQERGMSIELGFAHFTLPGGAQAGIVDVPGHQRFIKNMLMGATGMDMVILVVAADEGVMPQTREHFDILRLLGVSAGVIALTKSDLVDPEWTELVAEEVKEMVKGSFLQGAPIVPLSAVTRMGIGELLSALDEIASRTGERTGVGPFRMPVDRVFSIPGFGTVVTGTLRSGIVRTGEAAEILPQGVGSRVRGIQVHGEKQDLARAGSRVALNLANIELTQAVRGNVVAAASSLQPTSMIDVRLELLPQLGAPLRHRSRIRFHTGAVEIMGRVALLDREEAAPGASVLAQIRLETPTAVGRQDRFILRRYSPGILLGGGSILDPHPRRHRRNSAGLVDALLVRERGTPDELVSQALLNAGPTALLPAELASLTGLPQTEIMDALQRTSAPDALIPSGRGVVAVGNRWVHRSHVDEIERRGVELLDEHHRLHPLSPGLPKEELRRRAGRSLDAKVYNFCLTWLEEAGSIQQDGPLVRRREHEIKLEGEDAVVAARLIQTYRDAGVNPPFATEVLALFRGNGREQEVFEVLVYKGELVKIAEDLYLERERLQETINKAIELITASGSITVSQFRDAIGSSRKTVVPLMEYLD